MVPGLTSPPATAWAAALNEEVAVMGIVGWLVGMAVLGVLVLGAGVAKGVITQQQVLDVAMPWGSGVGLVLVALMGAAALPSLLFGVIMLTRHHSHALRWVIAGGAFAIVSGLYFSGAWTWLTQNAGPDVVQLVASGPRRQP